MNCSQVMTENPVCCLPTDSVSHAAHLMRRSDVQVLPVVSNWHSNKLVGIITDRDLALRVVAEALDAETTSVAKVMTTIVMACRADDDLSSAIGAMQEDRLNCLPILDDRDCVVGVLSRSDLDMRVGEVERVPRMFGRIRQAA